MHVAASASGIMDQPSEDEAHLSTHTHLHYFTHVPNLGAKGGSKYFSKASKLSLTGVQWRQGLVPIKWPPLHINKAGSAIAKGAVPPTIARPKQALPILPRMEAEKSAVLHLSVGSVVRDRLSTDGPYYGARTEHRPPPPFSLETLIADHATESNAEGPRCFALTVCRALSISQFMSCAEDGLRSNRVRAGHYWTSQH